MSAYAIPAVNKPAKLGKKQVQLIASGDLRLSWTVRGQAPPSMKWKQALAMAVAQVAYQIVRAHPYKESEKHGLLLDYRKRAWPSSPA